MRKILGTMRKAIVDYDMIQNGDRIAVGLSGGKDSIVLFEGLCQLRKFIGIDYSLVGVTVDPQFSGNPTDFSKVEEVCKRHDVEYIIKRSELAEIIFNVRQESNPCSLCARMRRGILHDITKEQGCNKIALGHHSDDAVETFLMNLAQEGRIGCFKPVTYLSRKDITMIRPMALLNEKEVRNACSREDLPVILSGCPVDGCTQREDVKNWLSEMEKGKYSGITQRIFGAIKRHELDGWK